jgi:guanine deaminase
MSADLDSLFITRTVALSRAHMLAGHGGPFGAVVVMDGKVVAEGWNQVTSTNDPTAHRAKSTRCWARTAPASRRSSR